MRGTRRAFLLALCALAAGCAAATATVSAPHSARLLHWSASNSAPVPIDVAVGRTDGRAVVAANGRLFLLSGTRLAPFSPGYRSDPGLEAYIALPSPRHAGCSFGTGTVYALRLANGHGVTRIRPNGQVSKFASISAPGLLNGIAFDESGAFGYRLLVTINDHSTTTVDALNCHGGVKTITRRAPRVEGGVAIAPRGFGRFGGDLIAPDELSGRIFAVTPRGGSRLVVNSGLPHGQDFGVESEGFVPADSRARPLVADRLTPGNPHPGDNLLLELSPAALRGQGLRPGDLLVAGEGGAFTDAVHCGLAGCRARYVANGPSQAHIEGHIAFVG